jgi:hypothetical protein
MLRVDIQSQQVVETENEVRRSLFEPEFQNFLPLKKM